MASSKKSMTSSIYFDENQIILLFYKVPPRFSRTLKRPAWTGWLCD